MIHVKVQYDAYNRTFKLIDREAAFLLEDYALYDLAVPFVTEEAEEHGAFAVIEPVMAHA